MNYFQRERELETDMAMQTQQRTVEVKGPVDFLIVKFPGNKFTGKIAPELSRLQDAGIIRVIDILFLSKDDDGNVRSFEIEDLGQVAVDDFRNFLGSIGGWLSQDDVDIIGNELPNNSSAGAILYENTWAVRLKGSLMDAGAEVIAQGRIPGELIDEAMKQSSIRGTSG